MIAIKICGITNLEDAFAACDYGAEALGFVFHEPSPRYLKPTESRKIIPKLPRDIAKVGVFVNPEISLVRNIREYCPLDFIQLSGDETPDFCGQIPSGMLIKVFSVGHAGAFDKLALYKARAFLIDSREPGHFGGTGRLSNWELADAIGRKHPVILAGGLNPENVETAIKVVSPRAVDVSSGVEISPGKKDRQKIRRFIEKVRSLPGGERGAIFSREASPPGAGGSAGGSVF